MISLGSSIANSIGSLFGFSSEKDDAEAKLASLKRKKRKQAESEVKAKAFIERYKKGIKSAKQFKHEKPSCWKTVKDSNRGGQLKN